MIIGLLNWSGHGNLGDDAMAEILTEAIKKRGHTVINQREYPDPNEVDAYIWGGGTLIAGHYGIFPSLDDIDKPIVGFGLGVCETHPPDLNIDNDHIKRSIGKCKAIFYRDQYSYDVAKHLNKSSILSYDPVFLHKYTPPKAGVENTLAINMIDSPLVDPKDYEKYIALDKEFDTTYFALSDKEDMAMCKKLGKDCTYFTDFKKLLEFLSTKELVLTTRLHAYIFAYMSGASNVFPIEYAPKVKRFREHVVDKSLTNGSMRRILEIQLDLALELLK